MTLPAQTSYPARFYIEVFGTSTMSVAHEILTVSASGAQTVPTIGLTTLSTDEAGWLALVNQDRASYGASPVVTDETTQELARLWLSWISQNHVEHDCASGDVGCPNKVAFAASENADFSSAGENLAYGQTSYEATEQGFMAEASNCPQPASYSTCQYAENTGHFLNIITPFVVWFGSSYTLNGTPYNGSSTTQYFDQEFSDASIAGNQVNLKTFRTVVRTP